MRVSHDDRAGIAQPDVEKGCRDNLGAVSRECTGCFFGQAVGADQLNPFAFSTGMNRPGERGDFCLSAFKVVEPEIAVAWKADPDAVVVSPFGWLNLSHDGGFSLQRPSGSSRTPCP